MKVRIDKMPVRIKGKRYNIGDTLEVDKTMYKTIKSICSIVKEDASPKKVNKEKPKPKAKVSNKSKYSRLTKDEIMLKLAEKGIAFDPNSRKDDLIELLER